MWTLRPSTGPWPSSGTQSSGRVRYNTRLSLVHHSNPLIGQQEEAVKRIVAGKSCLTLLATGTGKSLIYQLASYLYKEVSYHSDWLM